MKVIIWGTGKYYEANKHIIRNNVEIVGFVDNDKQKQGTELDGKKIYSPKEIDNVEFDILFILCKDYIGVRRQLMDMQFNRNIVVYDITQMEMLCDLPDAVLYDYSQHKENTKKILVYSLALSSTGAQNIMYVFLNELVKTGEYNITVISKSDGPLHKRLSEIGISVIISLDFRTENRILKSYIEAADMILVNTIWLAYVVDELRNTGKKVMWWLHESAMLSYIDIPCIKRAMEAENIYIYAVSRVVKDYLEEKCQEKNQIELFSFGIPEYSRKYRDKIVFAIIGGMGYIKGQDIFVDAVNCLPEETRKKAEFWIVGGGTLEKNIMEKIARIPEIMVKGEIDNRYMKYIYDSIDVVVSCSREESMSVVIMEGFMNEKLAIVSERAGISDFITNGNDGFVIANEDVEGFASKMKWAIEHKKEAAIMGKRSRKIYEANFSMEAFEKRIKELMSNMI